MIEVKPLDFPTFEEFAKRKPLSVLDYNFYHGTAVVNHLTRETDSAFWVNGGNLQSLCGVAFQLTEDNYEIVKQAIEVDRMARINALIG